MTIRADRNILSKLVARFQLFQSQILKLFVVGTIQPITDADALMARPRSFGGNYSTAVAIGTFVAIGTVPSGMRWRLRGGSGFQTGGASASVGVLAIQRAIPSSLGAGNATDAIGAVGVAPVATNQTAYLPQEVYAEANDVLGVVTILAVAGGAMNYVIDYLEEDVA